MDIEIVETLNSGDILVRGRDLGVVYGVENMPYLAMFGGNGADENGAWWGDVLLDGVPDGAARSETEALLLKVALNSGNLVLIEEAIKRDLSFLTRHIPGTEVKVRVRIVGNDRLRIEGMAGGQEFGFLWSPDEERGAEEESEEPVALVLWTSRIASGAAEHYAITPMTLELGAAEVDIPARCFYDAADESLFLTYLNGVAAAEGMGGVFAMSGNDFVYYQGTGEEWVVGTATVVLDEMATISLGVTTPLGGSQNWHYTYAGFTGMDGYHVTDFGDGSDAEYFTSSDDLNHNAEHTYADGFTGKEVNLFHDSTTIRAIRITDITTVYRAKTVEGRLPTNLTTLEIQSQSFPSPVDMTVLNTLTNLELFIISGCGISSFSPSLISAVMPALKTIAVPGNVLMPVDVDDVFISYVANNPGYGSIVGGSIFTEQTPPAAPSAGSLTERNDLIAAGWTLFTD